MGGKRAWKDDLVHFGGFDSARLVGLGFRSCCCAVRKASLGISQHDVMVASTTKSKVRFSKRFLACVEDKEVIS